MKITRYANAFLSIREGKNILACDPWIGIANYGGWLSYPIVKNGDKLLKKLKPTHIYISHIHSDHLDENLLSTSLKEKVLKKNIPIFIKNFEHKALYNKLVKLGFKNIIELKSWEIYDLGDLKIVIVPTNITNSDNLQDDIHYDIDTSLIVYSKKEDIVFYNNVDSPIDSNGLNDVKKFIKKYFNKKIDIACFSVGAASEYPQCFLNIDRKQEQNRIINNAKKSFVEKLNSLENNYYFFSGGAYIIPGKFYRLNKYIAQPSLDELQKLLPNSKYCKKMFEVDGGEMLVYKNGKWKKTKDKIIKNRCKNKKEAIHKYRKLKYEYTKFYKNFSKNKIDKLFQKALINYQKRLKHIDMNWEVTFKLYNNLQIDKNEQIKSNKKPLYTLKLGNKKAKYKLVCHLDYQLFMGLLEKKFNWNISLSGSIILFERKPNIFNPTITASLNFLTI